MKRERKTCIAEKERERERETQRCYASACGCLEIDLNTPCSLVVGMYNNTFVSAHTCIHTHTHTQSHFEKHVRRTRLHAHPLLNYFEMKTSILNLPEV